MSFKKWLNIVTIALVVLLIFFARHDIVEAWHLLWQVNIWIFLLIIPVQFLSYYAHGAMIFSYLRHGGDLQRISWYEKPQMALELNFVNHVFPTGGLSGISYMTYRLGRLGINHGRAATAQLVKFIVAFMSYLVLMVVAVVAVTVDGNLTQTTIVAACGLVALILLGTFLTAYILGSKRRLHTCSRLVDTLLNVKIRKLFRLQKPVFEREKINSFFDEMYDDYQVLRQHPRYLWAPFVWGLIYNIAEVGVFFVAFWALGEIVNPAPILIASGLASMVGTVVVTPGGAGGYEAVMILILTSAGVPLDVTVAGVLLARTSLILLTIATGYIFYNMSMKKYGKNSR